MASEGKCVGTWYCHTYVALPDSSYSMFHKIFKLIFPKSSFWPKTMYTEHIGNFPILLVQSFCGAVVNSCFLEYATVCVSNQK